MKTYSVQIECAGPLAMYARPDTGGSPTSYPAPTWSAAKGLLECIAFRSQGNAWFHPTRVELCRQTATPSRGIALQKYAFNYGGPLRKEQNVKAGTGMQVFATVLANPCFRIYADIRGAAGQAPDNPRHHLQDLFNRRIRQGRCYKTPAFGWSEFTCDYWGPFRQEWEIDDALNLDIPSMLASVWDRPQGGAYNSRFALNLRVERATLTYPEGTNDR